MSELNEKQAELCNTTENFVIVDAGPGTGKTHSIVQRYINILEKGVNPMKVLMLTFTRNAAEEMETRISGRITKILADDKENEHDLLRNALKNLRVSTIDSFCMDVVLNSPEIIRDFFDPENADMMLSRSASLSENETLNRQYFSEFYARFVRDRGDEYTINGVDFAAVIGENHMDVYELINKLMSRGIIPKKKGWMGKGKDFLIGDRGTAVKAMKDNMGRLTKKVKDIKDDDRFAVPPELIGISEIPDDVLNDIAYDDREGLLRIIHDIYYGYIAQCIKDNRLTFGLCELFALITLMKSKRSREMHSVDYLTIDEFQDTNELQMKICLLLLNKPNMCVVGDWKQGIFGFRYVSIDNITKFGQRIESFMDDLEASGLDFPFGPSEPIPIKFDCNYRSSDLIIKKGFESLEIPGSETDVPENGEIVPLTAMMDDRYQGMTGIDCISANDQEKEIKMAVDMITQYVLSGDYKVADEKDGEVVVRNAEFGDIAVLCRSSAYCTMMYDECIDRGIPVYLQGDIEIMSTEEGKLALAWLRYVNNPRDSRGLMAILDHLGYPLSEIKAILKSRDLVPDNISKQLSNLRKKRRRINDLMTSIFDFYGMNNGIVQSIINVISSAHDNSLMTVSDVIRLMEDDIAASTKYNVEPLIDKKAVTIQTIHKSKGLEYPIVIIVGINGGSFPSNKQDDGTLRFNDTIGVRCANTYISTTDDGGKHEMVIRSWKNALLNAGFPIDYSEERRLLFVAMTRAKQYLTLTSNMKSRKSKFFEHYSQQFGSIVPKVYDARKATKKNTAPRPEICRYDRKRMSVSVHDLMSTIQCNGDTSNREGKGKEYGEMVHEKAYIYLKWGKSDDSIEEMEYIRSIIEARRDSKLSAEIKCVLPMGDVSIKGTIDLLAEYDDRIEIHDYKTDPDDCFIDQYRLQLSIYALAVASLGKRVECYIDFVTQKRSVPVDPYPMEYIQSRIDEYKRTLELPI